MRKQLLYLTNTQLTASMWQSGRLSTEQSFDNDEAGWRALSAHLAIHRQVPVLLLIDLVEEDFQRDSIPHIFGKARSTLIARRLEQLYRDTPFRYSVRQGREKEGRKDDRMLFSALTNAPLLKPWIDAILKEKVPLAGIFSVALLSPILFAKLHLGMGPVLFITHQSGGLRQSYFHEGHLRFSRLTQLPSQSPEAIAEVANLEMVKTRQFLANTRLLQRGEPIEIVVLDNAETLQNLQTLSPDTTAATYRFIDLNEAAAKLRVGTADLAVCDILFLTLLARNQPSSHYALFEQTRLYTLWRARIALYLTSAAAITWSLFITGANTMGAIDAAKHTHELEKEVLIHQQHYQAVIESMPVTAANPHDMKSAVDLEQMIAQNAPNPNALLVEISHVLDKLPQLYVTELNWEATDKSEADQTVSAPTRISQIDTAPVVALVGVPKTPYEVVTLKGQVTPFTDDYRAALEDVHHFADELMKDKHIQVTITHPPLDIRPSVPLIGHAGDPAVTPSADFELRIFWTP